MKRISKSLSTVLYRNAGLAIMVAAGFLLFPLSCFARDAAAEPCVQTAVRVFRACRAEADSDYQLARARCVNIPNNSDCRELAAEERTEALEDCRDQMETRQDACDEFGPSQYDPIIDPANFVTGIDNPYFPLVPGTTFIYEGETSEGLEHDEFIVTHKTRVIMGVTCIEVRDRVTLDGKLAEDTRDWFAQDIDGNVWYFGENTHELENGLITTIDGSFMAGVDGAKAGIIMQAKPRIGDFYRQEFDLGNAEDFAEVTGLNAKVKVPFGSFHKCLRTEETTPLEPDLLEDKYYCPGVGNVLTVDRVAGDRVELIDIVTNSE